MSFNTSRVLFKFSGRLLLAIRHLSVTFLFFFNQTHSLKQNPVYFLSFWCIFFTQLKSSRRQGSGSFGQLGLVNAVPHTGPRTWQKTCFKPHAWLTNTFRTSIQTVCHARRSHIQFDINFLSTEVNMQQIKKKKSLPNLMMQYISKMLKSDLLLHRLLSSIYI